MDEDRITPEVENEIKILMFESFVGCCIEFSRKGFLPVQKTPNFFIENRCDTNERTSKMGWRNDFIYSPPT